MVCPVAASLTSTGVAGRPGLRDLGRSDLSNEEEDEDTEELDELCLYGLIRKSAKSRAEEDDD